MRVDENADFKSMGRSSRSLVAQARGAGKGDDLRPAQVAAREVARSWCRNFGHLWKDYLDECANGCGARSRKAGRSRTTRQVRRTA